jgi:tetratricopeptide (TPR) repeat protein
VATDFSSEPRLSVEDLPIVALSRPPDALEAARQVLDGAPGRREKSLALQAIGIAMRELGDTTAAVRHLRAALAVAETVGAERAADVRSSLGVTLAFAGRLAEGLRHLDQACSSARGVDAARIRVRRGFVLQIAGRPSEAVDDLRRASRTLGRAGDHLWEARADINLAQALIDCGQGRGADAVLTKAENLLVAAAQPFESAIARHNRGLLASLLGHVPEALAHFEAAEKMYATAGARPPELSEARCAALLAAGLPSEALRSGEEAVVLLRQRGGSPAFRANALVRVGDAALASGDAVLALRYAQQAERLFARQGRKRGRMLAQLRIVRARHAAGERGAALLHSASRLADSADAAALPEAIEAHLIAGQIALDAADPSAARRHLTRASKGRTSASALGRVMGWHAAALRASSSSHVRAAYDCCERGLQALDAHQLTFGALEARAAATAHGASLARLAIQHAAASGDPHLLLHWSERWRATTSALPPVHAPADDELAERLEALRRLKLSLDRAITDGQPTSALDRRQRQLENEIRSRTFREAGVEEQKFERLPLDHLLDGLRDTQLVEIVRVDDTLYVVVASSSGIKQHVAGSWPKALDAAESVRFALRRLSRRRRSEADLVALHTVARFVEETVLGASVKDLSDGPIVIAPPAALHPLPWGVLPSLTGRTVTISPSGLAWLRATAIEPPRRHSVALVVGPALPSQGAEVSALAAQYYDRRILKDGTATAANVLKALDGAWLAHVAAHGNFRRENPLFSSLRMDDGPLMILDLQQLKRAPYRLVLSSCDSGFSTVAGADEMLGLVTALGPLGMAGLLAPVVPIDDRAAVLFSVLIHEQLREGRTLAEALRHVRISSQEPSDDVTARSFVACGAA